MIFFALTCSEQNIIAKLLCINRNKVVADFDLLRTVLDGSNALGMSVKETDKGIQGDLRLQSRPQPALENLL